MLKIIKKLLGIKKKENIRLKEKIEKRFIPSARQHKSVGEISKFVVWFKEGTTKAYGWSQMYEFLKDVENVPCMDLTFGRPEPHEEFKEVNKGVLEQRK